MRILYIYIYWYNSVAHVPFPSSSEDQSCPILAKNVARPRHSLACPSVKCWEILWRFLDTTFDCHDSQRGKIDRKRPILHTESGGRLNMGVLRNIKRTRRQCGPKGNQENYIKCFLHSHRRDRVPAKKCSISLEGTLRRCEKGSLFVLVPWDPSLDPQQVEVSDVRKVQVL